MSLKHFALLFFFLVGLHGYSQSLEKSVEKVRQYYEQGSYNKSYTALTKLLIKIRKDEAKFKSALPSLYYYKAANEGILGKDDSLELSIRLYLQHASVSASEKNLAYGRALGEVNRIFIGQGKGKIADSINQIIGEIFYPNLNSISKEDFVEFKYTEAKTAYINGEYDKAIDSLKSYLPILAERANLSVKSYGKEFTPKEAQLQKRKNKIAYASWLNLLSRLYLRKGDFKQLDSSLKQSSLWMEKNIRRSDLPYWENIYLFGRLYEYHPNKNTAILQFDKALLYGGKKFNKGHLLALEIYERLLKNYLDTHYWKSFGKASRDYKSILTKNFTQKSPLFTNYTFIQVQRTLAGSKIDDEDLVLTESINGLKETPQKIKLLSLLHAVKIKMKKYEEAEKILYRISALRSNLNGKESLSFHEARVNLANHLVKYSDQFKESEAIYNESFFYKLARSLHPFHDIYIETLNHVASLYEQSDRFKEASAVLQKAREITAAKFSEGGVGYATELEKIASIQLQIGDIPKANENLNKSIALFEEMYDGSSIRDYAQALITQSKLVLLKGFYEEGVSNLQRAERFYRQTKDWSLSESPALESEWTKVLVQQGRYMEAEKILRQSLKQKEEEFGTEHRHLIPTLSNLARVVEEKGDYVEAEKVTLRALAITEKIFGKSSTKSCPLLLVQADIYLALGDFEKAKQALREVIEIQKGKFGSGNLENVKALTSLANLYISIDNNLTESERILSESKNLIYENLGKLNPSYANILTEVARLNIKQKKFKEAEGNLNEANDILINALGKENTLGTANIYILSGDLFVDQKKFDEAEVYYNRAKKIYDKILNERHPNYVKILSKLARLYFATGKYDQAQKNIDQVIKNYNEYISKFFPTLSESEKTKFWNLIKPDYEFYNSLSLVSKAADLSGILFNNALVTKSLLLNSSLKVRARILNSSDEDLKSKYYSWIEKKELLANSASYSQEELKTSGLDPLKISYEIEKVEKELNERSEYFKQSFENAAVDWRRVRSALKPGEVSVEIVRFRLFKEKFEDSVIYAAFILKPEFEKGPDIVFFKNGKDLEGRYLKQYRNLIKYKIPDKSSYWNYWEPIKRKLGTAQKIYLSPDGVFNQINLETLRSPDDSFVIDEENIVLINSTRDLDPERLKRKVSASSKTVSIFGNPQFYSSTPGELKLDNLPGAKKESEDLKSIMQESGWDSKIYLDDQATEDNIKALINPRIFHIATHGFFLPDQLGKTNNNHLDEFRQNPLFRAGLMLKGAGDLLNESSNSYSVNRQNGILTAYEAMNLNFDNTDLVVLSACETGLGDVQVGEGVFGLQRAFLVAGAQSLVMSLFKVSDQSTQQLMITFYKKWLESGNKRDAFLSAKREMRRIYKDPIDWGAFVMIGLE